MPTSPATSVYATQTVPTATPAQVGLTGRRRLMAVVLVGGSADSSVEFKNSTSDSGTVLLTLKALTNTTCGIDLTRLGGLTFDVGIYCKPAGSNALVYCWYE